MSFRNKDYYQILGVSPDVTSKEIKERYNKLMLENHPDRFKGLKVKYEAESDDVLLEVLEERIRQAEETCKLINEAFEVLSDPALRKTYDEETYEPKVPVPEIVVSPTKISFGTLNEGQRKSKSFTIENKGGPVASVDINWEDEPDWGGLIIEPNPGEFFPIKVTVTVNTDGIVPGHKSQRILVTIDGQVYMVDALLTIVATRPTTVPIPRTTAPPLGLTPATPLASVVAVLRPTARFLTRGRLIGAVVLGLMLICGFVGMISVETEQRQEEQQRQKILENFPVKITEAIRIRCLQYLEGEQRQIAEGRLGISGAVCVVFTVRNDWEAVAMVNPGEDSGIHGDFYNVLVDEGAGYPCGKPASIGSNVTETYVCFEKEDTVVGTLCLDVSLRAPKAGLGGSFGFLEKRVCSDVVSIP